VKIIVFDSVTGQMVSAINAGLLADGAHPSTVTGDCPTSNCTWGSYTSLAICSSVREIYSQVHRAKRFYGPPFDGQKKYIYAVGTYERSNPYASDSLTTVHLLFVGSEKYDSLEPSNLIHFHNVFFKNASKAYYLSNLDYKSDLVARGQARPSLTDLPQLYE
jgi:hypothetical protein